MNKSVFAYRNDVLCAETIPLPELAETEATPFLCTSAQQIWRNARDMASPFAGKAMQIDFRASAKPNLSILRVVADCAIGGIAVSSTGELERALEANIRPEQISFSSSRASRDDLLAAMLANARLYYAETLDDLRLMNETAVTLGKRVPVCLRLDLGLEGAAYPTPGFAVDLLASVMMVVMSSAGLSFEGLSFESAAYLHDADLLVKAYRLMLSIVALLRGEKMAPASLDFGSIPPEQFGNVPFDAQAELINQMMAPLDCAMSMQTGRRLIGDASLLVARVRSVRQKEGRPCLVLDASASNLPAATAGSYEIMPLYESREAARETILLGSDEEGERLLGGAHLLPPLEIGDMVALMPASLEGGETIAGSGPHRAVTEILVSGARSAVIRRCMPVAEVMAWEPLPEWMGAGCAA